MKLSEVKQRFQDPESLPYNGLEISVNPYTIRQPSTISGVDIPPHLQVDPDDRKSVSMRQWPTRTGKQVTAFGLIFGKYALSPLHCDTGGFLTHVRICFGKETWTMLLEIQAEDWERWASYKGGAHYDWDTRRVVRVDLNPCDTL